MPFKLIPEEQKPSKTNFQRAESFARIPLIAAVGGLAAIPGVAGNLAKGINDLVAAPLTKAISGSSVPYEETALGKVLPTTETHKRNLELGIPYLKPKNRIEQFGSNLASDTVEIFSPGKLFKMGKYAFSPLRSLGVSLFANTAGEGLYQMGGDQSKADMLKSATMLGASLLNPTGAKQISSDLYRRANAILPQNASVGTARLNQNLGRLENQILSGRQYNQLADSERFVIDEINKVKQSTQSGNVDVSTLSAIKRSLSETLQKAVFDLKDRASKARAKEKATQITGYLKDTLEDYGKVNPQWWKLQSSADKAHGAIAKSNFVSRVLEKFLKGRPEALAHIFGVGIPAGISIASPVGAATTTGIYQAAKVGTRMYRSPELRKHYSKVVGAALADNPKVIQKELDQMEKEINKQKKSRYKLID